MTTTAEFPNGNTARYRIEQLEKEVEDLSSKVDRLMWALIGLTISIAGSAVTFAITVATLKGGP